MKILPLCKSFQGTCVLDFPGAQLEKGKIYALVGANGSGKSTLARLLAGVLEPDRGRAWEEKPVTGYLPQRSFAFRMGTRRNILLGGGDPARAEAMMDALGIRHLENKRADRLSGGETARMALARLLMGSYEVLILDEPGAAMDMESTAAMEALVKDYVEEKQCAVVLVTHSLSQAERLGDEVWFLRKGRLAERGPAQRVLHAPGTEEMKEFLKFYR